MRFDFQPAVYIMANHKGGTIYCGVTSNPMQRAAQHREGQIDGFTKKYGCKRLVWFELHSTTEYAITREKQIKAGSRKRKIALIEAENPDWRDLYFEIAT
ncbi:MAG: GIY-YIG nuclease family protein [Alteripontixanthobacter sp.]